MCAFTFTARPKPFVQLGVMIFGLLLLALIFLGLVLGIKRIGLRGFRGLFVPALSLLLLIGAPLGGFGMRFLIFPRNLARYQAAADWVEKQDFGSEPIYVNFNLPTEFKDLADGIHAIRNPRCGTVIWFFWGGGFPVKHVVRIYSPTDSLDKADCLGDWRRPRKLAEHWYEASD